MLKLYIFLSGLIFSGILVSSLDYTDDPPDPFDPYEILEAQGGQAELSMVSIERQRLKYLLPRLNNIYAEYWEPESFDLPDQAEVHLYPTPQHDQGITIFFSVDEEVSDQDPDQQQHYRLGRMFINEVKKYSPRADSLGFFVAIDTTRETGENVLSNLQNARYLIPNRDDGESFEHFDFNAPTSTVSTMELLLKRLDLATDEFRDDYNTFLSLSGFNWKEDAHISFKDHPYVGTGILATFVVNEEVAESDPDFTQHQRLADYMQDTLDEIIEQLPVEMDEVDFGAKIKGEPPTVFN